MSKYSVLSLDESDQWSEQLNRIPPDQLDVFFTPEYYRLYQNYGDGKAQCFVFENNGDTALYPFLLNSVNDLGFKLEKSYYDVQGAYGYNGIVSTTSDPEFLTSLHRAWNSYTGEANVIAEFLRFHPLTGNQKFSDGNVDVMMNRRTMFVDLSKGYNEIFSGFKKNIRKQIIKCDEFFNLEIEILENSETGAEIFYKIYKEVMDRVNSIQYLYFNLEFFKSLIFTTKSALFIAKYNSIPIAAYVAFYNHNFIHAHLGGARTNYLFTSACSFLYSEMIKFGINNGCRMFFAGGGATSDPEDSLLRYKLNFSESTADFYIGKKIHNKEVYQEVVRQWEERNPEKSENFRNILLKYRY